MFRLDGMRQVCQTRTPFGTFISPSETITMSRRSGARLARRLPGLGACPCSRLPAVGLPAVGLPHVGCPAWRLPVQPTARHWAARRRAAHAGLHSLAAAPYPESSESACAGEGAPDAGRRLGWLLGYLRPRDPDNFVAE